MMPNEAARENAIERIEQMEVCFDTIRRAAACSPMSVRENESLQAMLRALIAYYEGGEWLADYERDERGELPPQLKRGVLAQDAVYDLLSVLNESCADGEGV